MAFERTEGSRPARPIRLAAGKVMPEQGGLVGAAGGRNVRVGFSVVGRIKSRGRTGSHAQLGGQQQGKPQHRRAAEMRRKLHENSSLAKYRKISF